MKSLSVFCTVFLAAFVCVPEVWAQDSGGGPEEEPPLLEQVRALDMDSLQRGRTTVHFTPGYRDRAERLAPRVDQALQLFADSLGAGLEEFHLILPGRAHWKQLTADQPYGVPKSLGAWQRDNMGGKRAEQAPLQPPAALMPADAEGAVFKQLLAFRDCASSGRRKRLEQVGLSWKEASRHYVEAITFHEVAHLVTDTGAYEVGMATGWFREFLANVFAYAYMHYAAPTPAEVWDSMTKVTLECQTPKHRTLEEYLLREYDAANYHWYQSNFIQRASQVIETHGFDFLRALPEAFPAEASSDSLPHDPGNLYRTLEILSEEEARRRAENVNQEILRRLEEITPGFQEWARGLELENVD